MGKLRAIKDWTREASCRDYDPEMWFQKEYAEAVAICRNCPVKFDCRAFAIAHNERGIWGGLTYGDRQKYPADVVLNLRLKFKEAGLLEKRDLAKERLSGLLGRIDSTKKEAV